MKHFLLQITLVPVDNCTSTRAFDQMQKQFLLLTETLQYNTEKTYYYKYYLLSQQCSHNTLVWHMELILCQYMHFDCFFFSELTSYEQ